MSATNFNPTIIYGLLAGSGKAANERSTSDIQDNIINNLRDEIEKSLPVIYLYDATVIVDSLLAAIHPEHAADLATYFDNLQYSDPVYGLDVFSFKDILPHHHHGSVNAFGARIDSEEGTEGFLSEYIDIYNNIYKNRGALIAKVHKAILTSTSKTGSIKSILDTYTGLSTRLASSIEELSQLGSPGIQNKLNRVVKSVGYLMRKYGNSIGLAKIVDASSFINDYDSNTMVLMFAPNFNISKKAPNKKVTTVLVSELAKYGISTTGYFQAGNFSAAGHVGIKDKESGEVSINTPLVQAFSTILAKHSANASGFINRFIKTTGHSNWLIEYNKTYADALPGISIGISFIRSQPSVYNSGVLSISEMSTVEAELQSIFNMSYKTALANMENKASRSTTPIDYITGVVRLSPTFSESIVDIVASTLLGTSYKASIGSAKGGTSTTITSGINSGSATKSPSIPKIKIPIKNASRTTNLNTAKVSLISLQSLINDKLMEQITNNMGDGTSKRLLNFRTGRFAASAHVERLTQSRDGMISAFYTYLKYPYQTFESGFKQGSPATRDPKLLISKSIREIAATKVANRMRAVLI